MSTVIEAESYDIYKKGFKSRGVYTEQQAEDLFLKVLSEKGLQDTFELSLSTSDQSLMLEAVKAFSVLMTHTIDYKRDSVWLQTANDLTQAYHAVRFYDYSIIRKKAPIVKVRYRGEKTIILHKGDTIGSVGNLDLICLDDLMYLEFGDEKNFYLGKWQSKEIELKEDDLGDYILEVTPKILSSVDNDYIYVQSYGTETFLDRTRHIQDFISNKAYRDFSLDINSTELYIANESKKYGLYEAIKDKKTVKVSYLETEGIYGSKLSFDGVQWNEDFTGNVDSTVILYKGYNGDTLQTLQRHAPLVSATKGKAHSMRDYQISFNAIPEIRSCNPFKDRGIGLVNKYTIQDENATTKITVDVTEFEIKNTLEGLKRFAERVMLKIPAYRVVVQDATNFTIQTKHSKMSMAVKNLENLQETKVSDPVEPECCTLLVPYIKEAFANKTDPDNIFTEGEELKVDAQTDSFKGWNAEPRYYPATDFGIHLKLEVRLHRDITDTTKFEQAVKELISRYSYKLESVVPIREIVTKIGQIEKEIDYDLDLKTVESCVLTNPLERYYFMRQDEYPVITVEIDYED